METLLQDLRYGPRMMLKRTGFTLVVVLTLGVSIGINTAVFSVVYAALVRPLPFAEPERLVAVLASNVKPMETLMSESVAQPRFTHNS